MVSSLWKLDKVIKENDLPIYIPSGLHKAKILIKLQVYSLLTKCDLNHNDFQITQLPINITSIW